MRRILSIALLILAGCLSDAPLKTAFNMAPADQGDGWAVSTPGAEGLDDASIERVYGIVFRENEYRTALSLLIVRHGKLVAEGYLRDPADIDRLVNIKSATKSVTSILTGIAIDKGFVKSVTQPISDFLPDYAPPGSEKGRITLEDLLTMRSGLQWDNDEDTETLMVDEPGDSLAFTIDQPLLYEPGKRFHYADGNPHLMSGVLDQATGASLDDFAFETLLAPLKIDVYVWERHRDGIAYGAYGLYLRPRDLAKFGELMLRNGAWNGTQIVSPAWVTASTQAVTNFNEGPYGYYWWIRPDMEAYAAIGHGGQYVYVVPADDLVIVMTANPYTDGIGVTRAQFEDLVFRIRHAVVKP